MIHIECKYSATSSWIACGLDDIRLDEQLWLIRDGSASRRTVFKLKPHSSFKPAEIILG